MTRPYSRQPLVRRGQRNTAAVALVLARDRTSGYDQLIAESGASRSSVKAALDRLEDHGLVLRDHGHDVLPCGTRRTNFAVVIGPWCQR